MANTVWLQNQAGNQFILGRCVGNPEPYIWTHALCVIWIAELFEDERRDAPAERIKKMADAMWSFLEPEHAAGRVVEVLDEGGDGEIDRARVVGELDWS